MKKNIYRLKPCHPHTLTKLDKKGLLKSISVWVKLDEMLRHY